MEHYKIEGILWHFKIIQKLCLADLAHTPAKMTDSASPPLPQTTTPSIATLPEKAPSLTHVLCLTCILLHNRQLSSIKYIPHTKANVF